MDLFIGNTKELEKKLKWEFIEGLNIVSKLSYDVATSGSSASIQTIIDLEEVNANIQELVLTLKEIFEMKIPKIPKIPKDTKQEMVEKSTVDNSPKQLNFILQYQITDIKKEIKLEEAKIQYILKKINDFPTLDIYMVYEFNDGVQTIDTDALKAYKSNNFKGRSIELMRQLTDSNLKSDYYQVLNDPTPKARGAMQPKSSLEEKNKAVMEAYTKYGNSESLDYREKIAGDEDYWVEVEKGGDFIGMEYTMYIEKIKLSKHWKHLDRVARFHFRNLRPTPPTITSKKPDEEKEKKGTYLTDVNHTIYEIISLKKLLQVKRDYVQYLVQKGRAFPNREVNYGSSGRDCIRKRFIPIPGEDLGLHGWDDYGVNSIADICYDNSNFMKHYFDFSSV